MLRKHVYLNNELVGEISSENGSEIHFSYTPEWCHSSGAIPLSLTLPLIHLEHPHKYAYPFFSKLTENNIQKIFDREDVEYNGSLRFDVAGNSSYNLLTPEDVNHKLSTLLKTSSEKPLIFPITIIDNEFYEASPGNFNSHILKIYPENNTEIVTNEIFSTLIANYLGLPTANISRISLPVGTCLLMERTDRLTVEATDAAVMGITSETIAQALPALNSRKNNTALTQLELVATMLRDYNTLPIVDIKNLVSLSLLTLLCGFDDMPLYQQRLKHTKSGLSLLPFTELICTAILPKHKFAGANILPRQDFQKINKEYFMQLAVTLGVGHRYLVDLTLRYCNALPRVTQLIFKDFPSLNTPTSQMISHLINYRAGMVKGLLKTKVQKKAQVA